MNGKTLTLKDFTVYSNVGDIPNAVGYSQLKNALIVIEQQARAAGFEKLIITGQRTANSTSANPRQIIIKTNLID